MAHQPDFQDSARRAAGVRASRFQASDAARLEASVLTEAADVVDVAAQGSPLAQTREASLSIVVVDDDLDMRAYVKCCLRLMKRLVGPVLEATDGEAALATVRDAMPNLVISATHLPEMDGFMLCGAIRADTALRHIPVLLVSGETLVHASQQRARKAGASGFLGKPFNARQFCAELESVLHSPWA